MTRVLVAGASGMLGRSLVPHLRAGGCEVVCHARSGEAEAIADLAEPAAARTLLDRIQPDVVVNLVALTNVDLCERSPNDAYRANARVVENLADWIGGRARRAHLIQVSTDQVYDGNGPHRESDVRLTNYYAYSKYIGELAAKAVSATVLRTNFFGPSDCPGRTSLSDWIVGSLRQGNPITVFDDVWFSPLSMQSLREYVMLGVEQRQSGVFNLGSRDGMSKADFAFALAETLGLPVSGMARGRSSERAFDAYRPKDMRMDSSLFAERFRVELPSLHEEIQKMRAAYA